jgi:hypothetical protein
VAKIRNIKIIGENRNNKRYDENNWVGVRLFVMNLFWLMRIKGKILFESV